MISSPGRLWISGDIFTIGDSRQIFQEEIFLGLPNPLKKRTAGVAFIILNANLSNYWPLIHTRGNLVKGCPGWCFFPYGPKNWVIAPPPGQVTRVQIVYLFISLYQVGLQYRRVMN